ncbi:hypothetical protein BaRGS_00024795 [Batillaria attramentaria]|uniref:Secreted protein n=1 Tax=Batillaria attramentaria TaxID=370345 RepID=A0ABD0K9X7_9CAEN
MLCGVLCGVTSSHLVLNGYRMLCVWSGLTMCLWTVEWTGNASPLFLSFVPYFPSSVAIATHVHICTSPLSGMVWLPAE